MIMGDIILDGAAIQTESDFHRIMSELLNFGPYYGNNLDALWDRLSTDVERPVKITWLKPELSRKNLDESFNKIIQVFEKTRLHDIKYNWDERFEYVLE